MTDSIATPSTSKQDFSQGVLLEDLQSMLSYYRNKADKQKLKRKMAVEGKVVERLNGVKRERPVADESTAASKKKESMAAQIYNLTEEMALLTIS